jgi:hypothetical protein
MDKAFFDHARFDFARFDVYVSTFDVALEQLKNVPLRGGGLDPCVEGFSREGYEREAVYLPLFEDAKAKLSKV